MRDQSSKQAILLAGVTALFADMGDARASGFALREQSAEGLGMADAGASVSDSLGAMFFNPAAMSLSSGTRLESVGSYVIPRIELEAATASTATGIAVGGTSHDADVAEDAFIPALYGVIDLTPEWRLGVAIVAPYGLASDYDTGWVGRYQALRSSLETVDLNPMLSWQATPWLSLGAGLRVEYATAELGNAIDFGSIGAAAGGGAPIGGITPVPTEQDGKVKVRGSDWSVGYNLGAVVLLGAGTRVGLGYRSAITHNLDGTADFDTGTSGMGAVLSAVTGQFVDTGASAELATPAMWSLGVQHRATPALTLAGELALTQWSAFNDLTVAFDNPAQADSVTDENWHDTIFASVGASYAFDEKLTLRAGVAFDQSPIGDADRTPRVPDGDRYWLAIGAGYRVADWLTLDAGYAHIFVQDTTVALSSSDPGSTYRGNLDASFSAGIDIVSVSARMRF